MRNRGFAVTVAVAIVVVAVISAQAKRLRTIPNGTWGGQHVQIVVAHGSAAIEYDCANGKINGPLKLSSRGRFDLRGTHAAEHGGPVRSDEASNSEPAQYSGWTDGRKMKLTVTLVNSKTEIGTFELTRGSEGRIFKCR
jgi:hypothetical protein